MISVLMSVYNEKLIWIQKAVDSILSQTYCNFEFIIVVDNPNIPKDIDDYLNDLQNRDNRIVIIKNEENIGLASCLNKGLQFSHGDYIARMDADDISFHDRFEKQLHYIESTGSDMVSGLRINIDEEGQIIDKVPNNYHDPVVHLAISNYIVHPSVLIRKEVLEKLDGYRKFSKSQDYDLWLRMISSGFKISIMDDYIIWYRIRSNSISVSNKLEQYYISEYQKLLYNQRIKNGHDNFSEENLKKYLDSKKITPKKNERYAKARQYMDDSIIKLKCKKISFIYYFLRSLLYYPEIGAKTIKAFVYLKTQKSI